MLDIVQVNPGRAAVAYDATQLIAVKNKIDKLISESKNKTVDNFSCIVDVKYDVIIFLNNYVYIHGLQSSEAFLNVEIANIATIAWYVLQNITL